VEIKYSSKAQEDIEYWKASGNKGVMDKITALLKDMAAHPFTGIGKPEPLKYGFTGCWSRRINATHRIIYAVHETGNYIYILALRYHYTKK
jgi:toxin YoeB